MRTAFVGGVLVLSLSAGAAYAAGAYTFADINFPSHEELPAFRDGLALSPLALSSQDKPVIVVHAFTVASDACAPAQQIRRNNHG